jgi:hypothetical protein
MVSSWQLSWPIVEVHRHLGQMRKLAEIGNSNRPVPFSGSLWERKTRVSARFESFRGENLDRRERSEFELPVPVSELSYNSIMLGFAIETGCEALLPRTAFLAALVFVVGSGGAKMELPLNGNVIQG